MFVPTPLLDCCNGCTLWNQRSFETRSRWCEKLGLRLAIKPSMYHNYGLYALVQGSSLAQGKLLFCANNHNRYSNHLFRPFSADIAWRQREDNPITICDSDWAIGCTGTRSFAAIIFLLFGSMQDVVCELNAPRGRTTLTGKKFTYTLIGADGSCLD